MMDVLLRVFTLLGGLAFFLYGMNVMSGGLSKIAGGSLERSLKVMTSNKLVAMLLGGAITIAIQSSSALTVMLVGLVNSGIMELGQTIGVIMGSNIGTTLTPWIMSLSGISGDGWIALLKPESFSPLVAFIGIALMMVSKSNKKKDIGKILIGFSILMYGMTLMGDSVDGLEQSPQFQSILTAFQNPLLGVLVGAVFTGIIQSSAASVGVLQTLASTGLISYGVAIPIIMGQNIGTCVTAMISSVGGNKNAKMVSVVHVTFNIVGTVVCLILFYGAHAIFHFDFVDDPINGVGIAGVHTIFNVATTLMLFPFTKQLERFANLVIKPAKEQESYEFLDERLLNNSAVAVNEANGMTLKMADLARSTVLDAIRLCQKYDEKLAADLRKREDELDRYEDKLGTFLVKLSSKSLSDADSKQVSKMLHTIGDLERLGDHAINVLMSAEEIRDKKITFSDQAKEELKVLTSALHEVLNLTIDAFSSNDLAGARMVEPLEEVVDQLINTIKEAHIERLQAGTCSIQTGFVLNDLLNNYERMSDHCSNIALALIETSAGCFDTHEYVNELKDTDDQDFSQVYKLYSEKYHL